MAAKQLGTSLHTIAFSEIIEVGRILWKDLAAKLRVYDPELLVKRVNYLFIRGSVEKSYFVLKKNKLFGG